MLEQGALRQKDGWMSSLFLPLYLSIQENRVSKKNVACAFFFFWLPLPALLTTKPQVSFRMREDVVVHGMFFAWPLDNCAVKACARTLRLLSLAELFIV